MVADMEKIIESITQGDQDTVKLLLDTYNTQFAECFFFDTDMQERKKLIILFLHTCFSATVLGLQQQKLEEFRMNKVRVSTGDSDSETDSTDDESDILLRQHLTAALLCFISGQLQPAVLQVCLHTLRILSRDRRAQEPFITDSALFTLAHLAGLSLVQPCPQQEEEEVEDQSARESSHTHRGEKTDVSTTALSVGSESPSTPMKAAASSTNGSGHQCCKWGSDHGHVLLARGKRDAREQTTEEEEQEKNGEVCRKEAMKVLCNVIYNSPKAQERASALRLLQGLWESLKQGIRSTAPPGGQFYKLRLLFLLTALRPELRLQLQQAHGVSVLTKALEQCLALRWGEGYEVLCDSTAPPISKEMSQEVIEILKTLFNITHMFHRQEPDEEDAALYRQLAAVLRHCLLLSCDGEDILEELQGHTVNILSALPLTCLDVLVSVHVDQASHKWEGVNMDCVHSLLLFMDKRVNRGQKLREKLTPVLNLLTESSRVHRETRHYLRQKILPPLRDVTIRPEHDTSLRGQLVRLMTHVDTDVKHCAAELLFVLCKENVGRFVKYTGYGNAAGLLAAQGLLNGGRSSAQYACRYSSDSDSDTEEYREAKAKINLVTGRVEAEQPNPMEGMTEEEKEEEARRLVSMINRLSRDQIIQPMSVSAEGRLVPLWGHMRSCTLDEENEDSEEDLDVMPERKEDTGMD